MEKFSGELQIRKIRSKGRLGGVIFSAASLEEEPKRYVVKADFNTAPNPSMFKEGHQWFVTGEIKKQTITWRDGTVATELTIIPSTLSFIKAANQNLISLLAKSKDFRGISEVKAKKLVTFFGDELYDIAANNDVQRLRPILGESIAQRLIQGLNQYQELHTLKLLDDLGVPPKVGESIINIWGTQTCDKIKHDPYILIMFMADLKALDEYAINRLGFAFDAPSRLTAYVKETLYNAFKSGNTCLPTSELKYRLKRQIGELAPLAIVAAHKAKEIVVEGELTQVRSMDIVESGIASIIYNISRTPKYPINTDKINDQINCYERQVGFKLTDEQRHAVLQCTTSHFTVLTGGAGCGKTTVLEAICFTLEELHLTRKIFLMALSGKAAKRITEVTGRQAMTIAAFMYNISPEDIPDDSVFIVDEASMVDVLSFYKILKCLPANGRLIMTGDEEQLPPVGVGLSLHALIGLPINNPSLRTVKRQSGETGIPQLGNQIRTDPKTHVDIDLHDFKGKGTGVSFIECNETEIETVVLRAYEELGGDGCNNDTLILSPTKSSHGGVLALNSLIHDQFATGAVIQFEHPEFGNINHSINGHFLRIGELVMYTKNDYRKGLRNGSIGTVISSLNDSVKVNFEGSLVDLDLSELQYLEHAYSLTVHKAQGSQFKRVIVVVKQTRNIDKHLIYTALTRAEKQAVFFKVVVIICLLIKQLLFLGLGELH
ncbi:ATP-dependent DNA helicase, partial [Vibrio astriarenae]